jgi:acetyl-CoA carboxylase carboxyl transferase subunit alpha
VVPEPLGGAHRDPAAAAVNLKSALLRNLDELGKLKPQELVDQRYAKYRAMGAWDAA